MESRRKRHADDREEERGKRSKREGKEMTREEIDALKRKLKGRSSSDHTRRHSSRESHSRADDGPDTFEHAKRLAQARAAALSASANRAAARAPPARPTPRATSKKPAAKQLVLRVDDLGREVDERGNPIRSKIFLPSTLRANIRKQAEEALKIEKPPSVTSTRFYDSRLRHHSADRKQKGMFHWVRGGTFVKKAEDLRARLAMEEIMREKRAKGETGEQDEDGVVHRPLKVLDTIPDVEWWDTAILERAEYAEGGKQPVLEKKITIYVEHPVPIKPPLEDKRVVELPMFLTKQERKRMRTRARLEREKERQLKIRMGFEAPPPPKVKLSNLMRVLGNEAIKDPTKVEKEVRAAEEARRKAHFDMNEANKLTPAERREKAQRKIIEDAKRQTVVALFRLDVGHLHPRHRFKVDINAKQNHLTGCCLMNSTRMKIIIVEGGRNSIKKYKQLLLHRVDWNDTDEQNTEKMEEEAETEVSQKPAGRVVQVWEGIVKKPTFPHFKFQPCRTEVEQRAFLEKNGLEHYFDLCKNYRD